MLVFLFFSTAYGLANLYVFFKLSNILSAGAAVDIPLGLLLLFMALSPVLIHLYSLRGSERSARLFAYIGYMWVSVIIILFPLALVVEAYNLIAQHGGLWLGKDLTSTVISPAYTFFMPLFIAAAINAYGLFEARSLRVEKLTVRTSKLPEGPDKITIAQIADLHLGIIVRDKTLDKIIREIENVKPDLIVSTGDLVDGVVHHVDRLAGKLEKLHARLGKFAVIGNHEFYGGLKRSVKFIEDSGFDLLRGRAVTPGGIINIAGVDDLLEFGNGGSKNLTHKSEEDILSGLSPDVFTVLLKHRSNVNNKSLGLLDLQLSGHTHKGQIFPINLITPFIFQHHTGFINLPKGSALYVSRGAGTAGPPVRFLSPPELTIIEIISENSQSVIPSPLAGEG